MNYNVTIHKKAGKGPAELFQVESENERQARAIGLHQFFNYGGRADYMKKVTVHKLHQVVI